LPQIPAKALRAHGLEVEYVLHLGLAAAPDIEILGYAARHDLVVVTLDGDYHQILALGRLLRPSVVRIRIEGLTEQPLAALLATVAVRFEVELRRGGGGVAARGGRFRR
jgi:predicted nuclease of predicted toxin-antitoxin system